MASPFRYFRKHQKAMMAVAAVIAMFVFVLADPLSNWLQQTVNSSGGSSPDATVVSWDGGKLSGRELDSLRQRRYFVSNCMQELQAQGARRILDEGGTPLQPTVPDFVLRRPEDLDSRSVAYGVVNTRILSELASQAGMTVSDQMINHYMREFGLRKVSDEDIANVLRRNSRGNLRFGEQQLFSGLRELLLGNYYMRNYTSAVQSVMPEQRWHDWLQINGRIALEAAILPAEGFVSETKDPSQEDLQTLYDQFKNNVKDVPQMVRGVRLPSPNPGFREPARVRLQYLLGDVTAWTDKLLDTVTEEEISDYYERNKRTQFVKEATSTSELSSEQEPPAETEAEGEAETEEAADPEPGEDSESPDDSETEESEASPEDKGEETSTPEESSGDSESTEPDAEVTEPADDESSSLESASPFRLTAFQEEEGEEETSESESTDSSDVTESTEEEAEVTEDNSEEAEDSAEETSAEEPPSENDTPEADADESPASSEDSAEEPVDYVPLEEVSDEIRRTLANDKAVLELQRVMERAYAELQTEYNQYGGALIEAQSAEQEPPAPPEKLANLGGMAEQAGLLHEETTLLSQLELAETFVGKAVDSQTRSQLVAGAAFSTEMDLYEPFLAQDLDGQWYLVLKVEDVPSQVSPLEDIGDEVATAWKQREASRLALERAEELAREAEESGDTLTNFFADKGFEVVTTDLFSWLSFGSTPAQMQRGPRLGEAPPLSAIGPDFMAEAFDLEPDEVVAISNHDQSNALVIRLDRRERTKEELRQLFLTEANDWYGGRIMAAYRWQNAQRGLLQQLSSRVGLDVSQLEQYLNPSDDQ